MKKIFKYDWDAIAGIVAAVAAIMMHFLHIIEADILLMIAVVLIALLFLRDLRRESQSEHLDACLHRTELSLKEIASQMRPQDAILIGPQSIHKVMEDFSRQAHGEMMWFHVCPLMFRRQSVFDALLKTAIENPHVKSIQFILDSGDKERWENEVVPKISQCSLAGKVQQTVWTSISGGVSAIISDQQTPGHTECLLSFWGEPFMARTPSHNVPRYIFHVQSHSELVGRMIEVVRGHRMNGAVQ